MRLKLYTAALMVAIAGVSQAGELSRISSLDDVKSPYVAVHRIDSGDANYVENVASKSMALAGLTHVFLVDEGIEGPAKFVADLMKEDGLFFYTESMDVSPEEALVIHLGEEEDPLLFSREQRESIDSWAATFIEKTTPRYLSEYNLDDDDPAIEGYDPVAYFISGEAKEGKDQLASVYRGVTYHFASKKNRSLFVKTPEAYVPAYGGWCATAMADNEKVGIDPKSYKITDGRLFLFYDGFWGDAKKPWLKDEAALTEKADTIWAETIGN